MTHWIANIVSKIFSVMRLKTLTFQDGPDIPLEIRLSDIAKQVYNVI